MMTKGEEQGDEFHLGVLIRDVEQMADVASHGAASKASLRESSARRFTED
jgi:hypothetical protein